MEKIIQYIWQKRKLSPHPLHTTDGKKVEVINPGLYNHDAGPDFLEAHIKIDGVLWVGNVEIHEKTSDWFRHHHNNDPRYKNIILHVVLQNDTSRPLFSSSPSLNPPTLVIEIPEYVLDNYDALLQSHTNPRCKDVVLSFQKMAIHNWMSSLLVERLEQKTKHIKELCVRFDNNWEDVLFIIFARYFGLGINSNAFEEWAKSFPIHIIKKFSNNLFQLEAFFLGQAGLLDNPPNIVISDLTKDKLEKLQREYKYLSTLYTTHPINVTMWKYMRTRPQNFPHTRLLQLAQFYHTRRFSISAVLEPFYSGVISKHYYYTLLDLPITVNTKNVIIINCIIPIIFAYGKYRGNILFCEKSLDLLESIPKENNRITRQWVDAGIWCENAADSQALIQLVKNYCYRRDCLHCRFGNEYIKRHPDFLCEEEI